jgi:hypothetical protein
MSDLARRADRQPAVPDPGAKPNPLKQLPAEWREPVAFFYAVYSDTLKGTTGLVARFRLWIKEYELTVAEGRAVMKRLMRPESAAAIQFPGQLMAALAEGVAEVVQGRRKAAEEAARRRRWEADCMAEGGEPIGRTHEPTL